MDTPSALRVGSAVVGLLALLASSAPAMAEVQDLLPGDLQVEAQEQLGGPLGDSLPHDGHLLNVTIGGFRFDVYCSGNGNGPPVKPYNGGVLIFVPGSGTYFGWADPCPPK